MGKRKNYGGFQKKNKLQGPEKTKLEDRDHDSLDGGQKVKLLLRSGFILISNAEHDVTTTKSRMKSLVQESKLVEQNALETDKIIKVRIEKSSVNK